MTLQEFLLELSLSTRPLAIRGLPLTPKGPRPYLCPKTLKSTISIAKRKKI